MKYLLRRLTLPLLVAAMVVTGSPAVPATAPPGMVRVPSTLETVPGTASGDNADDPAIWVNPGNTAQSLVITNEKNAKQLTVFNLAGQVVQRITSSNGFYGNVDVRGRIVAASHGGIRLWRVADTANGPRLVAAREATGNASTGGEGLCMYDPGASGVTGGLYVVNVHRTTDRVRVHPLTDKDGDGLLLVESPVRQFNLGGEGEGCVAHDATGALYMSQEDVGIWRYDLTGGGGLIPPRVKFASVGANLAPDVEGLALAGSVLYASAQNVASPRNSWFSRYNAASGAHLGTFRIVAGAGSDDCDQTDGIAAYGGYLNQRFPRGLFVCQDGFNEAPGSTGRQNFKFAPLDRVAG